MIAIKTDRFKWMVVKEKIILKHTRKRDGGFFLKKKSLITKVTGRFNRNHDRARVETVYFLCKNIIWRWFVSWRVGQFQCNPSLPLDYILETFSTFPFSVRFGFHNKPLARLYLEFPRHFCHLTFLFTLKLSQVFKTYRLLVVCHFCDTTKTCV